ncbi:hypothetical protein QBC33DRAFT_476818 [Phialemonium atrogriseum]|uniref:Mid2 domain-containing protein n=1 Tax=Phialemonium atrogriseum TaxID=1093897 RepID=A0AAJ0BUX7_9PEZI|nr:uncharacterized protein QBC33DRAFT_476818 [Phialemonium atrogriseum]KAK1764716.1 hypothetical protein QBC33DRAFT_476818 [Phialemonium atrogriseum]
MSALINQAPLNLGPLTTVFTPPPACTVAVGQRNGGLLGLGLLGGGSVGNVAFLGQTCDAGNPADVTTCWPPTSSGVPSPPVPFSGWGFYSPGLDCPAGHVSACSATGGAGGNSGWPVQFKLLDGETAIGCCPSGFACDNINGQTCLMVATSTAVPIVTCNGRRSAGVVTQTVPDAAASVTAFSLFAPMIQINFQSSDRPAPSTVPAAAAVTTSNARPDPTPTSSGDAATSSDTGAASTDAASTSAASARPGTAGTDESGSDDDDQQQPSSEGATGTGADPSLQTQAKETGRAGGLGNLSRGATMGIFIGGGAAGLLVVGSTLIFCLRKRRKEREERELDRMYGLDKLDSSTGLTRADEFPGFSYRGPEAAGDTSRSRNF